MDNQDKIFEHLKNASQKAETKDFPAMEKIWSRVEEKLDKKEDKKTILLWKKIAVAASLLLIISLGFLKFEKSISIQTPPLVSADSSKTGVNQQVLEKNEITLSDETKTVTKKEAIQILNNQIEEQQSVVLNETTISDTLMEGIPTAAIAAPSEISDQDDYFEEPNAKEKQAGSTAVLKAKKYDSAAMKYAKSEQYEEKSSKKEVQIPQKSTPLVVINGEALSHSSEVKKDQMMQRQLSKLNPENLESIVVLEEPLYIIDGIYYSENDLFGPNPTSPYAPLNKQEIKTVTILQDQEATKTYGEKGKKGVVIITTKTGKPASPK